MDSQAPAPNRRPAQAAPRPGRQLRSDNLRIPDIDPDRPLPTARGVLSAAEIEALLRPNLPEVDHTAPENVRPHVLADLDPSEQGEAREKAEILVARLSLALRRAGEFPAAMRLQGLTRGGFREALLPEAAGGAYALFADSGGHICAVLSLSARLPAACVDASCGAGAERIGAVQPRELTEIDRKLIARALCPMAACLPGGELVCIESRRAFALAMMPPGTGHILQLQMQVEDLVAEAVLIVSDWPTKAPENGVQVAIPALSPPRREGLTAVMTARIASLSVPVSRLSNLKPGDTLLLNLPADEPVQLLSGGRDGALVAEGEIGRKGSRMAVRVRRRTSLFRPG